MALQQRELIDQYIERLPGEGLGDARVRDFDVDVWALVMYYQQAADQDVDTVARDYHIPREAVAAALAYYQEHQAVIDARILTNLDVTV